jgi:hypothetical protein
MREKYVMWNVDEIECKDTVVSAQKMKAYGGRGVSCKLSATIALSPWEESSVLIE